MKTREKWLLFGAVVLALGLRTWGIDQGLPDLFHPDEPDYISRSLHMYKTGDLNPHFFNYPSLFFYLNTVACASFHQIGRFFGHFEKAADLQAPVSLTMGVTRAPMPSLVLACRAMTLLFSVSSILLVFLIGSRLSGSPKVGGLGALMMAVSPVNVVHSRYVTPDTFVVFFVLAAVFFSILVLKRGKLWHYAASGLCVGFAAGSKYNGGLVGLCPVLAHFIRTGKAGFRDYRVYLCAGLFAVGFALTSPYALLDYPEFLSDLKAEAEHYSLGHAGMEGQTVQWYLGFLWTTAGPLCLLALACILWGIRRRSVEVLFLAAFPLVYFVFIARFAVRNDRTIMPLTPFLYLLAAWGIVLFFEWLVRSEEFRRWRKPAVVAAILLVVVSLVYPAAVTIRANLRMSAPVSRQLAAQWVVGHLPQGASIALEAYSPFVDPQEYSVEGVRRMIDHPPKWYVERDFDFLIFSEGMFGRYYRRTEDFSSQVALYEEFFERFEPVKVFETGGYEIRIHQVGKS